MIAAALVLAPVSSALGQSRVGRSVRIGVFVLFKPKTILITFDSRCRKVVPVIDGEPRVDYVLGSGGSIEVRIEDDGLMSATGRDGGREVFSAPSARSLAFAPELVTNGPFNFTLSVPGGVTRKYRGALEIILRKNGTILPVITKNIEDYVASVVAAEIKGMSEKEMLKAQAVVARSYVTAHGPRHGKEDFDFCDSTHCQVFRGQSIWDDYGDKAGARVRAAIRRTSGETLYKNGKPLITYYTAACSGYTAVPSVIWGGSNNQNLVQVRDPFHKSGTKYFPWRRKIRRRHVINAVARGLGVSLSDSTRIRVSEKSELGDYVTKILISDGDRAWNMQGDVFRRRVSRSFGWNLILSNSFEIIQEGDYYVFTGRGFGHGIGFCQIGAREMAKMGKSYREILSYYFPGSKIKKKITQ